MTDTFYANELARRQDAEMRKDVGPRKTICGKGIKTIYYYPEIERYGAGDYHQPEIRYGEVEGGFESLDDLIRTYTQIGTKCPTCHGKAFVNLTITVESHGFMAKYDTCPACIGNDKCPSCGADLLLHMYESGCLECGWTSKAAGVEY